MRTIHDEKYIKLIKFMKARRLALGFTQERVSTKLNWQRTVLSNIETRERRLDVLEAIRLCHFYGISLADLDRAIGQEKKR